MKKDDHNRVKIGQNNENDYINASFIVSLKLN